jgi:type IV pilus assembly protein PilB
MLRHIKSEKINIITIEDPIEYELKDVNQVAVNEKTGLTFAFTLRSVLRQDPDVILVGEMRDTETSMIAYQASVTGHRVLSTLHTNDAVSSIIRLKNIGVPSYMIASALDGIVAQRLVRKICPHCKVDYRPTGEELKLAGIDKLKDNILYRGTGCERCSDSGYTGRTGIFEVLKLNKKTRNLITIDAPEHDIMEAALQTGMTPMHLDGIKKVVKGETTLEELTRVIYMVRDDNEDEVADSAPHCLSCKKTREPDWISCPFCMTKF